MAASRSRPTSERKSPEAITLGPGAGQILRIAETSLGQHPLEFVEVRLRQGPVAHELLQRDLVAVRAKVRPRLLAEAVEVRPGGGAPAQRDVLDLAELVGEVHVDDPAPALLEEAHEAAHAAPRGLQHRQRDVHPPLVAGQIAQQLLLLVDCRAGELLEHASCDLLGLAAEALLTDLPAADTAARVGRSSRSARLLDVVAYAARQVSDSNAALSSRQDGERPSCQVQRLARRHPHPGDASASCAAAATRRHQERQRPVSVPPPTLGRRRHRTPSPLTRRELRRPASQPVLEHCSCEADVAADGQGAARTAL